MTFITWIRTTQITYWQALILTAYIVYFTVLTLQFWDYTRNMGLRKGYRRVVFGHDQYFRLYHVVKIVLSFPPAVLGLTFPFLRKALSFQVYKFKSEKKKEAKDPQ